MFDIYTDGGGNADVPLYFSYIVLKGTKVKRHLNQFLAKNLIDIRKYPVRQVLIEDELLNQTNPMPHNMYPQVSLQDLWIPKNCEVVDSQGNGTNNIAEYMALYYTLTTTSEYRPAHIYMDSQLVVKQFHGDWSCKQPHLQPWLRACISNRYDIELSWLPRKNIVAKLGH